MSIHLERALSSLKKRILDLGARAEESVRQAVRALTTRDSELAELVIENDQLIDQLEVELEEEGLKILALYQPVASDLRLVVAILKINNDLERIGDLAVNIAERALYLSSRKPPVMLFDFPGMARLAGDMLRRALDSLVNEDVSAARNVCADDDTVDEMNRQVFTQVQLGLREQFDDVEILIHILSASRHLERIADQATNIAEDVIYMVSGDIVRHHVEDYLRDGAEKRA